MCSIKSILPILATRHCLPLIAIGTMCTSVDGVTSISGFLSLAVGLDCCQLFGVQPGLALQNHRPRTAPAPHYR
jgi:hypothetical protein